jgi:hypothetical protein
VGDGLGTLTGFASAAEIAPAMKGRLFAFINPAVSCRFRFGATGRFKNAHMTSKPREFILWIEGIGFSFIIAIVWATEILQVPHLLFAEPPSFHLARPILRSVVIMCVWAAVHISTRRLLKRLHKLEEYLLICAWCRKIGHEGDWMTMEKYFGSAFSTPTTHGICPECSKRVRTSFQHDNAHALSAAPRCSNGAATVSRAPR